MIKNFSIKKLIIILACILTLFFIVGFATIKINGNYNNNNVIANDKNSGSPVDSSSIVLKDDGSSTSNDMEYMDNGHITLCSVDLSDSCTAKIHFEGNIQSGKAKLVLVTPNKNVEVLKEIFSSDNSTYSEDLLVNCTPGTNTLKFVAKDYSGNFTISQYDKVVFNFNSDQDGDFKFLFGNTSTSALSLRHQHENSKSFAHNNI